MISVLLVRSLRLIAVSAALVVGQLVCQSRVTIHVCCSSQGIVDDVHQISVTVKDGAGVTTTVTLGVPKLSDSEAIAVGLALLLSQRTGDQFGSGETTNKRFTGEPQSTEDLTVPTGYTVTDVEVERKTSDGFQTNDGQLKGYIGDKKVSTPPLGPSPPFDTLELEVVQFTGDPLTVEIDLYELDASGQIVAEYHKKTIREDAAEHPLLEIGDWFAGFGADVQYISGTAITVALPFAVHEVDFMASEETDASSPALYLVEYGMVAK